MKDDLIFLQVYYFEQVTLHIRLSDMFLKLS